MVDKHGDWGYTYDDMGRLTGETMPGGYEVRHTYNDNSNRLTYKLFKNGSYIKNESYSYDDQGRMISMTDNMSTGAKVEYMYNANGNMTKRSVKTTATGEPTIFQNYAYNHAGLPVSIENKTTWNGNTSNMSQRDEVYNYNLDDSMAEKLLVNVGGNALKTEYTYDMLGRLTSEEEFYANGSSWRKSAYEFDASSNRSKKTMTGASSNVTTYTYNKANRLMSETTTPGVCSTKTYEYDASGNLIKRTGAGATASYTYDAYNRMAAATSGAVTTNYLYSGNGNRFSKKVGTAAATRHIWDGQDITYDDGLNQNYIHGARGVEAVTVGSDVYGFLVNFHGDVTGSYKILSSGISKNRSTEYDAYGISKVTQVDTFITNPYGFSGEYTDFETKFQYLRARYYDTETGRFTQEDTVDDPNNFANLYLYCAANPVKYIDPTGNALVINGKNATESSNILKEIQKLTNHKLAWEDKKKTKVKIEKKIDGKLKNGNKLIQRMIDNKKHTVTVRNTAVFKAVPINSNNVFETKKGSGSTVHFNLKKAPKTLCYINGKNGNVEWTPTPVHIALAHEMIHAERNMRGVRKKGDESNFPFTYKVPEKKSFLFWSWTGSKTIKVKDVPREEMAVIGLTNTTKVWNHHTKDDVTENMIRDDHGLKKRGAW